MNKIDDILNYLQGQQPIINHPDELTEQIMQNLPDMDKIPTNGNTKKSYQKTSRTHAIVKVIQIITTTAAIWLIGMFVYLHHTPVEKYQDLNHYTIDIRHGSTLNGMYMTYMKKKETKMMSYTQLKRKIHEND